MKNKCENKYYRCIISKAKGLYANFREHLPTWILAIIAFASLGVTLASLLITYRQVELVNRPFVSIEEVYWRQEKDSPWFMSGFKMKNYGNKPAQDFSLRNVRIVILNLNKEMLIEKLKQEQGNVPEEYFQEYLLDLRNKVYWETVNLLADYFYKHPDAKRSEVMNFLDLWKDKTFNNKKLKYNGNLLVGIVEVNNDMFDYFAETSSLVYPNQENNGRRYAQQMGEGGIEDVKKGDNFLILYWAIRYKGLLNKILWFDSPVYSTYYIGYHLDPRMTIDSMGHPAYLLRELKSWSKIE